MNCHFDASPPSTEKLARFKPILSVNGTEFTASRIAFVRYWDSLGARSAGSKEHYPIDKNGELILSIPLSENTSTAAIWIIVDENENRRADAGDISCQKNNILFSKNNPGNFITFKRSSDCTTMSNVANTFLNSAAASAHTQYTCISTPANWGLYDAQLPGASQRFSNDEHTLRKADWFPLFQYTTNASANFQSASVSLALPSGNWDTVCYNNGASFSHKNWTHP